MKWLLLLMLVSTTFAINTKQVQEFLFTSVHQGNVQKLGFNTLDDLNKVEFGEPLTFATVDSDSLNSYPHSGFSITSDFQYLPVLVEERAICFIIIDQAGNAVALGYQQLARELNKVTTQHNVPLEVITLYSSTQISSYLFSIPPTSRSEKANLTILRPGWDNNRSTSLSNESDVIDQIKMGRR